MRQLGKALLRDVARRMSGRQGQRDLRQAGAAGEPSGATREWAFGDTEPWDVTRTLTNAVRRTVAEGGSPRGGFRLDIRDVEVTETEARTQAAVALLVDTSFSMAMDGRWVPMKRTALALHTLIRSRFRGDHLQLIGFGRHAEVMDIEQLTALDAMWDKGTNLHHALLLANRHFRKHPHAQPVLLIVTDGEPTSHLEPDGEVWFSYPPHPLTVAYAVRELDNAFRLGAQTTFFRLGDDPGLARFIESMAARVEGRVVAPELDDLGAAVVGSYLGSRGPSGGGPAATTATSSAAGGSGSATDPAWARAFHPWRFGVSPADRPSSRFTVLVRNWGVRVSGLGSEKRLRLAPAVIQEEFRHASAPRSRARRRRRPAPRNVRCRTRRRRQAAPAAQEPGGRGHAPRGWHLRCRRHVGRRGDGHVLQGGADQGRFDGRVQDRHVHLLVAHRHRDARQRLAHRARPRRAQAEQACDHVGPAPRRHCPDGQLLVELGQQHRRRHHHPGLPGR